MGTVNEGQAVITAVAEALKKDTPEKGLYPEDAYLVSYLARAARIFQDKGLPSYLRELWGIQIEGKVLDGPESFKIIFSYRVNMAQLKEDLKEVFEKTDTFYSRCLGCEIVRRPDRIEALLDGDNMEDQKEYKIEFEAPDIFRCLWRR